MKTMTALDVSKSLIEFGLNDPDNFDISNLKLQKLLYYVQGTSLVLTGKRMFNENIVKWQYGPVVVEIYHHFKGHKNQILDIETEEINKKIPQENLEIIKNVFDYFGQFSAIQLMNLTHNEMPWNSVEIGEEINDSLLIDYFRTIVVA